MAKSRNRKERTAKSSVKRRLAEHTTGFTGTTLQLPEGIKLYSVVKEKTTLDVLNYKVGEGNPFADKGQLHYERTYYVHRGIGPNKSSYVCPARTANKPCPICEHIEELKKESDADPDYIKSLRPSERQLFNVIDSSDVEHIKVWDCSWYLFGKRLDTELEDILEEDEDAPEQNFADLEEGYSLRCGFEKKSFGGNSFFECSTIKFKERDEIDEELASKIVCLDDILIILPYDKLKEIYLDTPTAEDMEDEDVKKINRKNTKKKKSKPVENDDDIEDDIEEEEEVKKPTKSKKSKKSEPEDDDDLLDDEDDLDEEEEEVKKPTKSKKQSKPVDEDDEEDSIDDEEEDDDSHLDDEDDLLDDEDDLLDNDDEEEEEKVKKSKKDSKTKSARTSPKSLKKDVSKKPKHSCPHGGTFGVDCDELNECITCDYWDECDDEKNID